MSSRVGVRASEPKRSFLAGSCRQRLLELGLSALIREFHVQSLLSPSRRRSKQPYVSLRGVPSSALVAIRMRHNYG